MKDIINKIKKLLAMSEQNGASENESMMASEKALELLKQQLFDPLDQLFFHLEAFLVEHKTILHHLFQGYNR